MSKNQAATGCQTMHWPRVYIRGACKLVAQNSVQPLPIKREEVQRLDSSTHLPPSAGSVAGGVGQCNIGIMNRAGLQGHGWYQDCPFYVLALKLICWVIAEYRRTGDSEAAAAPLRVVESAGDYTTASDCKSARPYWDAVDMPAVCSEKEAARLQRGLRKDVERSLVQSVLEFTQVF
eukprot:1670583-Amphidinium_carterae.1